MCTFHSMMFERAYRGGTPRQAAAGSRELKSRCPLPRRELGAGSGASRPTTGPQRDVGTGGVVPGTVPGTCRGRAGQKSASDLG
jgi:hypothetical protein